MAPQGFHFIVEASGCGPVISQVDRLQEILVEAAKRAKTQVWSVSFHRFPPDGVSGVVVISESHLSIHTWPEVGYMALDIYTCGEESKPQVAVDYVLEQIGAKQTHITEITRGLDDGDMEYYHSFVTWQEVLKRNGN
ncbi:adenosylmethionine decarboxylase [Aminivibrio sp.]|jgi:S-adenosylmethionine decarboxylase|uniref:adenosylmethionine decarboxylase n=1 Tax=Aminivibrio sp. TaxID=1872489 RepID=UPI001A42C2EC|nr:adenosylmethionine decarboxylase [Aminivibrio sp.]MBL3539633.1 adenosylmethionine decarboxylase [Aminivibrio sp.]MDK2958332.1 S-adenosylmethionine decarboxylase [Synergistaceae bacterium]